MIDVSLLGLSNVSTSPKTYNLLKRCLQQEKSEFICESPFASSVEHQNKLDSVIASLSDAQFHVLTRMLACSPPPRHLIYLGICAMLPQDLQALQGSEAIHLATGVPEFAKQKYLYPANKYLHQKIPSNYGKRTQVLRHNRIYTWSIDDVPGARDLLLKTVLYLKGVGSGMNASNISVLQRFASLSETVSRELTRRWSGKWPLIWKGIDKITLDVTSAYGPDGVFLPTAEMLQVLNRDRDATPFGFRIIAPTEVPERMLYEACGYERQDVPVQQTRSWCGH